MQITDNVQRDKAVLRVIIIEGLVNMLVLLAKLAVGLTTGSLAIIADAVHSLTDVVNNIVAWIVIRLSSSPPDVEHPYGHKKFETMAVFILAAMLVVVSFEVAIHAIKKEDSEIIHSTWGLVTMLTVLAINLALSIWQRRWAVRLKSDILHADASHTFSDALTTIAVIAGWQLSALGYVWLDRVCALAVSGLILYLAYRLFKSVFPIFVDQNAFDPNSLANAVKRIDGVLQVRRVRSRWIGSEKLVDLVIAVDPHLSTNESHDIADNVEALIAEQYAVSDISIHVEPFLEK